MTAPVRGARRPTPRRLRAEAQAAVDFAVAFPGRKAAPYRLVRVQALPGARSGLTLLYEAPDGARFKLRHRLGVVPLAEELELTGQTASLVRVAGRALYVVDGAYVGGEPIDGWHRHLTRTVLTWETGEVVSELEYRNDGGVELRRMLDLAAGTTVPWRARLHRRSLARRRGEGSYGRGVASRENGAGEPVATPRA